jgi:uncharacterized membrane protein YukC
MLSDEDIKLNETESFIQSGSIFTNDYSLKIFETYEQNVNWFNDNIEDMEEKYNGKFIAVISPENFLVMDNFDDLIEELKINQKLEHSFITSIPPKGTVSIYSLL